MRKSTVITLTLLLLLSGIIIMPHTVHAEDYAGHVSYKYKDKHMSIKFFQNDAFQAGIVQYPYEYMAAAWGGVKNQRVTIKVTYNYQDEGVVVWGEVLHSDVQARMIQKSEWVNKSVSDKRTIPGGTGWIDPYVKTYGDMGGDMDIHAGVVTAYFSFLVNSTYYHPGMFQIQIKASVQRMTSTTKEIIGKIDGEFTYGHLDVKHVHDGTTSNYTSIQFMINDGKYRVDFYYVGNGTHPYNINRGAVTGEDVKHLKTFGPFTSKDNPVTLTYYFKDSDPTGIYIWDIQSLNSDGTATLFSWTPTVHNNPYTLARDSPPEIFVTLSTHSRVNGIMKITISAISKDSKTIQVWLIGYYTNNKYMIPDPATPLVQLYMVPYVLNSGENKTINVQMKWGGGFAVTAIAKDDLGAMNITRTWAAVQDFEGGHGGVGNYNQNPSWFEWPWGSVLNMVIMLIAILLLFSGDRRLQVAGVILFFAAFVNWGYFVHVVLNALNPLHWFHLG